MLCGMAAITPLPALAQTSDAKFAAWLRGVRAEAARAGVDEGTLGTALDGIEEVPRVLELARARVDRALAAKETLRLRTDYLARSM